MNDKKEQEHSRAGPQGACLSVKHRQGGEQQEYSNGREGSEAKLKDYGSRSVSGL